MSRLGYKLLAIAAAGLLLRLAVMPLTFHDDLVFLQYPLRQIADGQLNIFSDYSSHYDVYSNHFASYPPLYFYLAGLFRVGANFFSPALNNWLEHCWAIYAAVASGKAASLAPGASYFSDPAGFLLYRNLFLTKAHYLLFDILAAVLILRLVRDPRRKLLALALWAFNPFTLITVYVQGQHDLMTTALVVLALFLCMRRRPGPALALLSVGVMIKVYPLLLIPPVLALYGGNRRELLRLAIWTAAPFVIVLLPLAATTPAILFKLFAHPNATNRVADPSFLHLGQKLLAGGSYLALLAHLFFRWNREGRREALDLVLVFATVLLLLALGVGLELRYFLWLTPFLILLAVRDRATVSLVMLQALLLLALRYPPSASLQLRAFRPLEPNLFSAFPSLDRILSEAVPVALLYPVLYRLFLIVTALLLVWLWWPAIIRKLVGERLLIRSAAWSTAVVALCMLSLTIVGLVGYYRGLNPGEPFLHYSRKTLLELSAQPATAGSNSSFRAVLVAPEDGLYGISAVGAAGTFESREFRVSGEDVVPGQAGGFSTTARLPLLKQSRGMRLELELKAPSGDQPMAAVTHQGWVNNPAMTLRSLLANLWTDRPFFLFYCLSLLILLLVALLSSIAALRAAAA